MWHRGLMRAGALMLVGGSSSQNGTQVGKGVEMLGSLSPAALRSHTDASHWLNPTQSQLARVLKSYSHTRVGGQSEAWKDGVWIRKQGMKGNGKAGMAFSRT